MSELDENSFPISVPQPFQQFLERPDHAQSGRNRHSRSGKAKLADPLVEHDRNVVGMVQDTDSRTSLQLTTKLLQQSAKAAIPLTRIPDPTAVGLQPQVAVSRRYRPSLPLATTDGGLPVTGTAVGRSGRVTGNEAGVCRPITGDPYQDPVSYSSECGGMGGGTAPAAHLNWGRLDPVTAGKVTVAQTWGGQRVTGPSVEHRPNVTGDEPGSCRPLTGTPYQGPSTVFGWCDLDEVEPAAGRLDPRPDGVAVTGDVPTATETVTGTTEIGPLDTDTVTGTPYYSDLRAPEPAADDWARSRAFPVALARRLVGREQEANGEAPPSSVPGGITGSFAVGDGMVTGNNEFLFRPRLNGDRSKQPVAVTGEGRTEGRTITGSPAAWTADDRVTGTEGYIAAGRNPSEGGSGSHGWAGARKFAYLATPGGPADDGKVTGRVGGNPKGTARIISRRNDTCTYKQDRAVAIASNIQ